MNSKSSPNKTDLDPDNLPAHVAIIMDGNGRWAKKKLLNRFKGHEKGTETVRNIVKACRNIGIPFLTLYAFSTENWQRPKTEITALMALLSRYLKTEKEEMMENDIHLNAIGQIDRLPKNVLNELNRTMEETRNNRSMVLTLALSYGSRAELVRMVQDIARKAKDGGIDPATIDEAAVSRHLYTTGMPDPDLLIRTSGEMRISNFLLWQIAYSEIYITDTLWPDFTKEEFVRILKEYQTRDRRFGKV